MDRDLSKREQAALRHIRNALLHGRSPSVREIQSALGYRSPRSAAQIVERLIARGVLARRTNKRLQLRSLPEGDETHARTVDVPLVGTAPCGTPILAEENVEAVVPVSVRLAKPPHRYFLLRANGDSMNLAGIKDGELVLVRQQSTADNGDRVVALVDDNATIKVFRTGGDVITLLPRSTNKTHKPIVLGTDFQVQGVVVAAVQDWRKG